MQFETPLLAGQLVKRYKRFLADIELETGELITAHCPNTGSMKSCNEVGSRVWVRFVDDPKRKLQYTWELVEIDNQFLASINTGRANALVREAIEQNWIAELQDYCQIRSEVKYGRENSRIDLLLSDDQKPNCYVEIKNATLLEADGIGYFPDAVTARGTKHLRELAEMNAQGHRAVLFFNVAHTGIHTIKPAQHIDTEYSETLANVINQGVEVLAYQCAINPEKIECRTPLEFSL